LSVRQGQQLSDLLGDLDIPWNAAWDGQAVVIEGNDLPVVELASGLRVTLLSPTRSGLKKMGAKWREELMKRGPVEAPISQSKVASEATFEREDEEEEAAYSGAADSKEEPFSKEERYEEQQSLDVEWLASRPFRGDRSIVNAASVAVLAEFDGTSLLIGGDARADVLANSLQILLTQRGEKRLPLDAFVVPHAGSRSSLSVELLEMIECDRYLFSTNGSKFRHPDRVTVARILVHGRDGPNSSLTLIFNYRSESTTVWDSNELQARYHYAAVYPASEKEAGIDVVLRGGTDRAGWATESDVPDDY